MAAIVWADVTSLPGAAQYAGISSEAQTMILAVANQVLNVSGMDGEDGACTKLARCNFAAHFAALETMGPKGWVTSERAESLARSYATVPGRSLFEQTSFGRAFLTLIRPFFAGPVVL